VTITLGPVGILGLLSFILVAALVYDGEKQTGMFGGLGHALAIMAVLILWAGLGLGKFFAWMGWL
jgi:hypothetical protein